MTYLLISFGILVIYVLVYAGKSFVWLVEQKITSPFIMAYDRPMIIEKRFNAHPFHASFQYSRSEHEIINDDKRKAIIKRFTLGLCEEIVSQGFVEIQEQEDKLMPYFRRLNFRVMVYKEEL